MASDFGHFRKCRHFENMLFELGAVDYSYQFSYEYDFGKSENF
jgi:hypothetical protein